MTELLKIEELTVAPANAPDRKLVNMVSFSIKPGRTTCVVGESGSGKSLTALSVMGLLSKQLVRTHGRVLFRGKDLASLSPEEMRKIRGRQIGMIFQEYQLALHTTL